MFPKRSLAISFAVFAALASLAWAYQAPNTRPLESSSNYENSPAAGQIGPGAGQSPSSGAVNAGPSGSLASAMANFMVRTGLVVGPDNQGRLVVERVRPESDAARLGVKVGDVLTSVNGTETNTMRGLEHYLTSHIGQSAFDIRMGRSGRTFSHPMGRQTSLMGMTIFPNSADAPYVYSVQPDSPAAKAHVKPGDVITAVGHQTTDTMSKFMNMAVPLVRRSDPGEGVPLRVARNGQSVKISVPRPKDSDLQPLTPSEQHVLDTQHGVLTPQTQELVVPRERIAQKEPRNQNRRQPQNGGAALAAQPQATAPNNQQAQNGLSGGGFLGGLGGGVAPSTMGTGTTGTGTSGALPAVVAQLYGTSQNQLQSTASSTATRSGRGANRNNFSNSGVIGYVTIQSSVPLNASANGLNNGATANGTTTGTNGTTSGTTNTGTSATNGFGTSNAAGVLNNNSFGSPTPGFNNSATGTNGSTGTNPTPTIGEGGTNPRTGNTGTTPGVNPQTGNTGNGNANTNSNYPSTISAQVNGLPSGTYGLVISQYGNCGDAAAVASGPAAYSIGSISVSSNGVGQVSNVSVPYPPQAFLGRVVTLVPPTAAGSGSGAIAGRSQLQSAGNRNSATSQNPNQILACGVFMAPNGQQNFSNSSGNYNGTPGIFGPGMGPGPGNTNTGNGNNGSNNGNNGTGTGTGGSNNPPVKPLQNGGAPGSAGGGIAAPAAGVGR